MAPLNVNMDSRVFLLSQLTKRLRTPEPKEGQLFGFRTEDRRLFVLAASTCTTRDNLKGDQTLLPPPLICVGKFQVVKGEHSKPDLHENEVALIWDQEELHLYMAKNEEVIKCAFTEASEDDLSGQCLLARVTFTFDLTSKDTASAITNTIQSLVELVRSPATCFRLEDSGLILQNNGESGVLTFGANGGSATDRIMSFVSVPKKKKPGHYYINFRLMLNRSASTSTDAPVVRIDNRKSSVLSSQFNGEGLVYLLKTDRVAKVAGLLAESVIQQLHLAEYWLKKQLKDKKMRGCLTSYNSNHYFIGHAISVVYPDKCDDQELEPYRKELHDVLLLPEDRPILRKGNGLATKDTKSPVLRNTHVGLKPSSARGIVATVKGIYGYHHYMQDNFDDNKWGCAYRSLQTLVSWFRFQGYTEKPVPTHTEIQKCLVDIGDKPSSFEGSRQWIGSTEVGFVLDNMFNISSKFIFVNSGADLADRGRELARHFDTQGTPIMIGGGVLAHTIIGIDFNPQSGDISFLILDPHYTGVDNHDAIQAKGWCGWKGPEFWDPKAYYNLCLPQRPLCL